MRSVFALLALSAVFGTGSCGQANGEPPAPAAAEPPAEPPKQTQLPQGWRAPRSEAERQAIARIERGADDLLRTLTGRLSAAIGDAGGLVEAANVCASEAQVLTKNVAEKHEIELGRSSTKLRNAAANRPPTWVTPWLQEHAKHQAAEVAVAVGIVEHEGRTYARTIRPLGVRPLCLNCHGPQANITDEVRAVLAQHYPDDAATGYAIGELRGALWAEFEVHGTAR